MAEKTLQGLLDRVQYLIKGRIGFGDIEKRNANIAVLLTEYDDLLTDNHTQSATTALHFMANYLLMDELQDPNPHKMAKQEYAIQSERQEFRRKEREVTAGEHMDLVVWGYSPIAQQTQPKRNLPEKSRAARNVKGINKRKREQFQKRHNPDGFLTVEAVQCRNLYATYDHHTGEIVILNSKRASFVEEDGIGNACLYFPKKWKPAKTEAFRVQLLDGEGDMHTHQALHRYLLSNYFNLIY